MSHLAKFGVFIFFLTCSTLIRAQEYDDQVVLKKEIDTLLSKANIARENNDTAVYLRDAQLALKLAFDIKDSIRIATCNQYMGQYYIWNGNNILAFEFYRKALDISEKVGDKNGVGESLFSMGILSYSSNDFDEANRLFSKVLPYLKQQQKLRRYNTTLYLLGLCKTELREFDQAKRLLFLALRNFELNNDSIRCSECHSGILQLAVRQNSVMWAEDLYDKFLHSTSQPNENVKPWVEYEMSFLYEQNERYDKALYHALRALDAADKVTINDFMEFKLNKLLSRIYEHNNNPRAALVYYKKAMKNKESLNSEKMAKQLESLKLSSEMKVQQNEIDLLNSELKINLLARRIFYLVIFSLIFFLLLMFLFMLSRSRLTQKLKENNVSLGEAVIKSDNLLLNILPAEIAEELKQTGGAMAKQYNHVTVIFTDFVNFTGISQLLSPTELVAEIHKNFTVFDSIMEKYGLEKIKTIGDAYLAVCGLPNEVTDHAQRVVNAAQEIIAYMKTSNGKFAIRIGINSGPVVAGIVGVKKYAYDIWGDTVNTAARMEQHSEAGRINISGATYELVKNNFICEHRGKIQAKHKGEIDMYFILTK